MTLARFAAVGLIAVLMCSTSALAQSGVQTGRVDPARLNEATRVLASDEFEGRAPVTPGEDRTVEWLSQQFQALGLEPGGPNGSWVQVAQVSRTSQDGPAAISVSANGRTTELQRAKDVIVSSDRPVERISLTDAPLVFVGYGVFAASIRNHVISRPRMLVWMRRTFAGAFAALGAKLAFADR